MAIRSVPPAARAPARLRRRAGARRLRQERARACAAAKAPPPPAAEAAVFSVLATTDLKDAQALEADGREGHRREAALLLGRHDGKHRGRAHRQDQGRRRLVRQRQVPALRSAGPGAGEAAGKDHALADHRRRQRVGGEEARLGRPGDGREGDLEDDHQGRGRRQAQLRALQPGDLEPGLHGADGRGRRGQRQGRCARRRRRRPRRDRQLPQGLQAGRRQLDLPGGEVHRRAGPAAQRLHQLRELAADAQQRRQAEGEAGPRLSEGRRLDRRLSVHAAAGGAPRRLPEGRRLPQGRRGADLAGAPDPAPADLGRGRGPGRRPVPEGRRHAGRARVLARPAALRRPDRRLPQRVPPADRLDLRASTPAAAWKATAGARSWCRRSTTSPATTAR